MTTTSKGHANKIIDNAEKKADDVCIDKSRHSRLSEMLGDDEEIKQEICNKASKERNNKERIECDSMVNKTERCCMSNAEMSNLDYAIERFKEKDNKECKKHKHEIESDSNRDDDSTTCCKDSNVDDKLFLSNKEKSVITLRGSKESK